MTPKIFVLNPNSSQVVTDGIDAAMAPLRLPGGPAIHCMTLAEGPPGIQSQRDIDQLVDPLCRQAQSLEAEASAFVVACFSDPGLHSLREITRVPVLGIAETGVLTALSLGHRFGVISILPASIPRHLRYFGAMGVTDRLAADLSIGMGVKELVDRAKTMERLVAVGRQLRDQHRADTVVLGCAGMAGMREELQSHLGIPVVEPTQATVAVALGRALLKW
ncbi:aspartate/glutamate racemase family protein [Variovorax sp. LT1R16]|uniref:aspartate/glutamate racemase family protein n=1 Tax=Variovorax sp. LT1R16 TaxID=3443728 RepID=UPI003F4568EC